MKYMKIVFLISLSLLSFGCAQTFDQATKLEAATLYYNNSCRGVDNVNIDFSTMKPAVEDYYWKIDYERTFHIGMSREKMCKKLEKKFNLSN